MQGKQIALNEENWKDNFLFSSSEGKLLKLNGKYYVGEQNIDLCPECDLTYFLDKITLLESNIDDLLTIEGNDIIIGGVDMYGRGKVVFINVKQETIFAVFQKEFKSFFLDFLFEKNNQFSLSISYNLSEESVFWLEFHFFENENTVNLEDFTLLD